MSNSAPTDVKVTVQGRPTSEVAALVAVGQRQDDARARVGGGHVHALRGRDRQTSGPVDGWGLRAGRLGAGDGGAGLGAEEQGLARREPLTNGPMVMLSIVQPAWVEVNDPVAGDDAGRPLVPELNPEPLGWSRCRCRPWSRPVAFARIGPQAVSKPVARANSRVVFIGRFSPSPRASAADVSPVCEGRECGPSLARRFATLRATPAHARPARANGPARSAVLRIARGVGAGVAAAEEAGDPGLAELVLVRGVGV